VTRVVVPAARNGRGSPTLAGIESAPRSEQTLTRVMVELHRDRLRYVFDAPGKGVWHSWEAGLWRPNITGIEIRSAWKAIVRVRQAVAESKDDKLVSWASAGSEARHRAIAKLAATAPEFAIEHLRMDTNPHLLAVGNGTLDLEALALREARPADLITRGTAVPYDPDARCPTWEQFIEDVFHGEQAMTAYVQRVCGYVLQGENPEQVFFVLMGAGRNGKGALVRALHKVLGTLAMDANFSTFCGKSPDAGAPRPDLVRLAGTRLVTVGEGRKSEPLNSALVKSLSGGDHLTVRGLYAHEISFTPQATFIFHTNALPSTDATDDAFWRRAQVIEFTVSFDPDVPALHHLPNDPAVEKRIGEELPGILAWMVEGLRQWQSGGLNPPEAVRNATRQQRDVDDPFALFVDETDDLPGDGDKIEKSELRRRFETWCRSNNVFPVPSAQMIGRLAQRHGFEVTSSRNYTRRARPATGEATAPIHESMPF
jgi:putative DNA primase/helicase